ncbi:hypothetical protein OHT76_44085 [Streptomyces sp. NBC_00287]|uniref:hypothetical protein n=1 Tax=Streptomyces sp. NBC_00287 TaxID=2975702 RepID=UPI002E2D1556|nr:hypothetical protein [Streptomyces sp. NBC_00287]
MPERPKLKRPDDTAIEAARGRAMNAFIALLLELGEGSHELNIVVERTNDTIVAADLPVSVGASPLRGRYTERDEYLRFFALLTFALEGSTIRQAVLVATTAEAPIARACGWDIRAGWLHPMDTHELQDALVPCPGVTAPLRLVYPAPSLNPDEPAEENAQG